MALFGFLQDNLILDDSQYGFRAERAVSDQLILTYNLVTLWYDQGSTVDLILFDFDQGVRQSPPPDTP
ncbi:hypothetical protein Pmani_001183 [Petrolisthes manimaculis]|uniref:Uncharacterized protein n=1 Tax=Petrolisthes manimaculis TaxID=1843537 RepID=A0AAE1QL26_9EUCA|nr:hypothetical protein Pmani_001183 [Petrolisthes manimaculis]